MKRFSKSLAVLLLVMALTPKKSFAVNFSSRACQSMTTGLAITGVITTFFTKNRMVKYALISPYLASFIVICLTSRAEAQEIVEQSRSGEISNEQFVKLSNEIGFSNALFVMELKAQGVDDEAIQDQIIQMIESDIDAT